MTDSLKKIRRAKPQVGTIVEILAYGEDREELLKAVCAAFQTVECVQSLMSFHDPNSDLSRINRHGFHEPQHVHPWTFEVIHKAMELSQFTAGIFDVTIAPLLMDYGFLPQNFFQSGDPAEAMGYEKIRLHPDKSISLRHPGTRIDLGGIAKGFAVDQAVLAMQKFNISSALINAGGDMRAFGDGGFPVLIRKDDGSLADATRIILKNQALANSGTYYERRSRSDGSILLPYIDAHRCTSAAKIPAVSIVSDSCMISDALTKVAMLQGSGSMRFLKPYGAKWLFG